MEKLGLPPGGVDEVFISHAHGDHMGGLADFVCARPVECYLPSSARPPSRAPKVTEVTGPLQMHEGIFSTGELAGVEQSLLVESGQVRARGAGAVIELD